MAFENLRASIINSSDYTFGLSYDGRWAVEFEGIDGIFYLCGDNVNFKDKAVIQRSFFYSEKSNGERVIFLINPHN